MITGVHEAVSEAVSDVVSDAVSDVHEAVRKAQSRREQLREQTDHKIMKATLAICCTVCSWKLRDYRISAMSSCRKTVC